MNSDNQTLIKFSGKVKKKREKYSDENSKYFLIQGVSNAFNNQSEMKFSKSQNENMFTVHVHIRAGTPVTFSSF